jgi:hypothetical protein
MPHCIAAGCFFSIPIVPLATTAFGTNLAANTRRQFPQIIPGKDSYPYPNELRLI